MPKSTAILYPLTSRHPDKSEADFNKWYDEVHAPSRASCPGVNRVSRYKATDGQQPEWLAIYELSDTSALQTPEYKKARENDGDDESTMFKLLDRRVYKVFSDIKREDYDTYTGNRDMIHVCTEPINHVSENEFNAWYEDEHVPYLQKCPGWLRSVRCIIEDSRDPRDTSNPEGNTASRAKYLAFHEWEDGDKVYASDEHKYAITTPWRMRIMTSIDEKSEERRRFKLWKQF
ncbi:hypothetical protein NA57DRAFT_59306 [Rhizodiscina lignyota]|uniref:Uncharacterized protein n=1 Tax=Rhizodiscina lignyota TaxID=1504668 RepID=A0A9P4IBC3_9PEZI|nr:hypothetical protein NA57DRAFT_59306 [Rhizodiscina lignyota]